QVCFGRGRNAFAQRTAERHAAALASCVEFRTPSARDDSLAVLLVPVVTAPFVVSQTSMGAGAVPGSRYPAFQARHRCLLFARDRDRNTRSLTGGRGFFGRAASLAPHAA